MGSEHLQFDIDEDNLLDNAEEIYLVDTCYSSLHESPLGIISQDDDDVEEGKAL